MYICCVHCIFRLNMDATDYMFPSLLVNVFDYVLIFNYYAPATKSRGAY